MNSANTKPSRKLESPAKVRSNPLLSLPAEHPPLEPVCECGSSTGVWSEAVREDRGNRGRQGSDGSVLPAAPALHPSLFP